MGWADNYIERLLAGETVQFRPRGNSMRGKIESGQLVTVEPIVDHSTLRNGDVVLCRVKGKQFLHKIVDNHDGTSEEFLIGNNRGYTNGWTSAKNIYGKVTKIEK
jgi:SOS-response transcriptional repressor LexA